MEELINFLKEQISLCDDDLDDRDCGHQNGILISKRQAIEIVKNHSHLHSVGGMLCDCKEEDNIPVKYICTRCNNEWKP
jgi:hypothetical protein